MALMVGTHVTSTPGPKLLNMSITPEIPWGPFQATCYPPLPHPAGFQPLTAVAMVTVSVPRKHMNGPPVFSILAYLAPHVALAFLSWAVFLLPVEDDPVV